MLSFHGPCLLLLGSEVATPVLGGWHRSLGSPGLSVRRELGAGEVVFRGGFGVSWISPGGARLGTALVREDSVHFHGKGFPVENGPGLAVTIE